MCTQQNGNVPSGDSEQTRQTNFQLHFSHGNEMYYNNIIITDVTKCAGACDDAHFATTTATTAPYRRRPSSHRPTTPTLYYCRLSSARQPQTLPSANQIV